MKINDIIDLKNKCTGCMACADVCHTKSIKVFTGCDSFKYTSVDNDLCVNCGRCYSVCPVANKTVSCYEQHLYAAFSNDMDIRYAGSSGGLFEVIASFYLNEGYYVCGAAFSGKTLKHRIINNTKDLKPLLKSKYIQSDTSGIYAQISDLLSKGEKVLFCGTPCQVSALKNYIPGRYNEKLLTIDFICHGVPSQKYFDMYIKSLENKRSGIVSDFTFRVKDNRYKHAHGFRYSVIKDDKVSQVDGIYTQSSYYYAFKHYLFLRESCYSCNYTTLSRVSDITLADFWGIEKYDPNYKTDKGVSMVITNSLEGEQMLNSVRSEINCKEFPVRYGVESNFCLTHSTEKPANRDEIIDSLNKFGYERTAEKFFKSSWKNNIYWLIPSRIRTVIRKIRG